VSTQIQLFVIRPGLSTLLFKAAVFYPSLASGSTLMTKKDQVRDERKTKKIPPFI